MNLGTITLEIRAQGSKEGGRNELDFGGGIWQGRGRKPLAGRRVKIREDTE